MANICLYKILIKGSKPACYAFIDMMPSYNADKEILREEGTDEVYELVLRGDCKWSVSAYTNRMENPQPFTDEEIAKIEDGDHWDKTLKDKSILLNCEIFCNSKDIDNSSWAIFEHYNKGTVIRDECPKELHIKRGRDYDTYGVAVFDLSSSRDNKENYGRQCKVRFASGYLYYQGDFEQGDIIRSSGSDKGTLGRIVSIEDDVFIYGKQKIHKKVGHAGPFVEWDVEAVWKSRKAKDRRVWLTEMGYDSETTKAKFYTLASHMWTEFAYKNGDDWKLFLEELQNGNLKDTHDKVE